MTDESWKVGKGPIIRNSIYLGEVYDAQKEQEGWDQDGFNDVAWHNAKKAIKSVGRLKAQIQPPIKETVKFKPVNISYIKEGVAIVDLGQNIAGWATLKVKGAAGTTVKLRFGELLYPDGTLNVMTSVCGQIKSPGIGGPGAPDVAEQTDTYILKGKGEEVYTPRFTFHAFRYIEVTGYPGVLKLDDIEGVRLNSAIKKAGSFSCSNELFNRIQYVAEQTFPNNLLGVQSDCPGRERFAYGDDISVAAETHLYNYDMATFYTKTVRDFEDAARPNGALTLVAPWTGHEIGGFDPDGGDFAKLDGGKNVGTGAMTGVLAHPLLLDKLYQYYGDKQLLEEQYKVMRRSLEFIQSQADDFIIHVGLGDWLSLVENNKEVISTALFYHHAIIAARVAKILGHQEDAKEYTALSGKVKEAFIKKFLKPGTGQIDSHTQTAQVFALYYDLIPPNERQAAIDVLIDDILIDHKGHLSTGIFGTKYLLEV
ncbi:MAG: alpha-L-rhamnosidase, partial [Bacteroidetes bacterium]